jgi:hypothetical protein
MIFVLGGYYRETSEVSADQLHTSLSLSLSLSVQSTNIHTIEFSTRYILSTITRLSFLFYCLYLFGQISLSLSSLLPFHLLFLAFGYWAGPSSFIFGGFIIITLFLENFTPMVNHITLIYII